MCVIPNIVLEIYNKMLEIDNGMVWMVESKKLASLGSSLVVLGIVFGTDRLIGYSFIGAGVGSSIINMHASERSRKAVMRNW